MIEDLIAALWLPPRRAATRSGSTVRYAYMDDQVHAALSRRAAEAGISVPERLRREAARLAARPSVEEWLERTRRRPSEISAADLVEALDEMRGPWPDARG